MPIKREKYTDGLFTFEKVTIPCDECSSEIEQALDAAFPTLEDDLNRIEMKLKELISRNNEEIDYNRNETLKDILKRTKHLEAVKNYAEDGLLRLELVRNNIKDNKTNDAVWNTLLMMNNYWRSYFHTMPIKSAIINEPIRTKQSQNAPSERYRDIEGTMLNLASEKWARNPNRSTNEVAIEIQGNLIKSEVEKVPCVKTITNHIKHLKPKK